MERKIGEIFEFGGEWYQCLKSASCDECAFSNSNCIDYPSLKCSVDDRTDNCSVIFKKLEKVGEPYELYGHFIQKYRFFHSPAIQVNGTCISKTINTDNIIKIEIKQNKENNMEEKNNNQTEDTPLKRLVNEYINNKIEYSDFEKRVKMLYVDDKREKPELIPFDLSKAKSGRKIYTRDGKMARIVDFESKGTRPIVALVTEDEEEVPYKYNIDGSYNCSQIQSDYDLFMALKKVEGWININAGIIPYETREEAEKHSRGENRQIKVSWGGLIMERKIGEIFKYNGEWYQCLKSNGTCVDCAGFTKYYDFCYGFDGCTGRIFKKIHKTGKPFSDYCPDGRIIYFQRYECYQEPIIEGDIIWHRVDPTLVDIEIKQNKENNMEEKKLNLKPFDIQKAREGKPVCTRDGRKARIICFDAKGDKPIIALVEMGTAETPNNYPIDGKAVSAKETSCDLMMLPEKKEGWIIVSKNATIYDSLEDVKKSFDSDNDLGICKIEWEEWHETKDRRNI